MMLTRECLKLHGCPLAEDASDWCGAGWIGFSMASLGETGKHQNNPGSHACFSLVMNGYQQINGKSI